MIIHLYNNILNYSSINNSSIIKEYNLRIYINSEGVNIGIFLKGNPIRYNYRSLGTIYTAQVYIRNNKCYYTPRYSLPLNYHRLTPEWKYAYHRCQYDSFSHDIN